MVNHNATGIGIWRRILVSIMLYFQPSKMKISNWSWWFLIWIFLIHDCAILGENHEILSTKNSVAYPTLKIDDFWDPKFPKKSVQKVTHPKSDAFLRFWPNSKCVSFWSDSLESILGIFVWKYPRIRHKYEFHGFWLVSQLAVRWENRFRMNHTEKSQNSD